MMIKSYQWALLSILTTASFVLQAQVTKHIVAHDTLCEICQDAVNFATTEGPIDDNPDLAKFLKQDRTFFAATKIHGRYVYFIFDELEDIGKINEEVAQEGGSKISWYYTDGILS